MNKDKLIAEAKHYADLYKQADAQGLETVKKFYLAKYDKIVRLLGYDPLV